MYHLITHQFHQYRKSIKGERENLESMPALKHKEVMNREVKDLKAAILLLNKIMRLDER